MRTQKPAHQKLRRPSPAWLLGFLLAISCCIFSVVSLPIDPAEAESASAVIVGVERLYVRRGPGAEFPPFATLTKGDTVEVQEMQGEWARIVTGSGLSGYVRSNFLVLPGEHKKPAVTPPALPTATTKTPPVAKPTPTAKPTANVKLPPPTAAEPTTLRAANARSKSLESEIQSLQQQIIELKGRKEGTTGVPVVGAPASATPPSRPPVSGTPVAAMPASVTPASVTPTSGTPESSTGAAATPLPTPTQVAAVPGETDPAQAEIARLTTLVETLQRRLDARPPIEGLTSPIVPSDSPAHSWSTGLTLGIIGVAIGWFIGSTRGRKPDRGRRPRVRF